MNESSLKPNERIPLISSWIQILTPILLTLVLGSYIYAWYIDVRSTEKVERVITVVGELNGKLERLLGQLEGRPTGRRDR